MGRAALEGCVDHVPVLLEEVVALFSEQQIYTFFDGTVGAGGHAHALLSAHPEIRQYVASDRDPAALAIARERLAPWGDRVVFVRARIGEAVQTVRSLKVGPVQGALVDLGVSSMQIDSQERGFSFRFNAPLDMRMDPNLLESAETLLNMASEQELGRMIREYGEEKRWRAVARAIVAQREIAPLKTTFDLLEVLTRVLGRPKRGEIHPVTKTFQALRIAVNRELEEVSLFVESLDSLLERGGRCGVITFHSLEDRIVKQRFQWYASDKWNSSGLGNGVFLDKQPQMRLVHRKGVVPTDEEMLRNPRSRSARLRSVESN